LGRTDIEDALKRLDSLIQEETKMAIVQVKKATSELTDDVKKACLDISSNINEITRWSSTASMACDVNTKALP